MKITDYVLGYSPPIWATFVAGVFSVITIFLSLFLIFEHLSSYKNPEEQKFLIGVVLMVPCYSVESSSHLFWLGMPVLINGMFNTEEKRAKMNDAMWHAYDKALGDSKLLRQTGGPLFLLDFQSLTWNCGPHCTSDGMHYDGAIYEAAVQIMLNTLLIESHQTL